MIQIWRLSERSAGNLGLCCTNDGLLLGSTALVELRDGRYTVRKRSEIERLLTRGYQVDLSVDGLMSGLAAVASALNANDPCLAHIAAVHLRVPDLPGRNARDSMEAEDRLIKAAVASAAGIRKASPNDPKHPGWPAGTEGRRGGQFRPKDAAEITQQIKRRFYRKMLRTGFLAILRWGFEGAGNLVPIVGVAADVALAADIASTIVEFGNLIIDANAAFDFIKEGPHSLAELQVSSDKYEEFSSYDQFRKSASGPELMALLVKRFGPAGDGEQYHHIVTQGGANQANFSPEELHNTDNIVRLPTLLHEAVNAAYLAESENSNMNMYQWLQTRPYEVQREWGLKILRNLRILK